MLKCFTLENSLQGLCHLLKKVIPEDDAFIVTTTVIDQLTGELVGEMDGVFDFSLLNNPNTAVLFQLQIKGRGTIVLDLFERDQGSQRSATAGQNIATLTEQGSSRLANQSGVAYINMNLPREDFQYLSYSILTDMFHEFGHAMNIALSHTKYQYLSGARGTTDMIEIPSHFAEQFLTDYSFVKQFALVPFSKTTQNHPGEEAKPNQTQMLPIERGIFNKMIFCDRIFEFIELEESLYFTALDVELHSFGQESQDLSEQTLLDTNYKHLCAMSVNLQAKGTSLTGKGLPSQAKSSKEIDSIIERVLFEDNYSSDECYRKVAGILFDTNDKMQHPKKADIFEKLSQQFSQEADETNYENEYELDPQKIGKLKDNYLFCRFHHLFEYEATYYSYLIAKLSSRKLFNEGLGSNEGGKLSKGNRTHMFLGRGESRLSQRESKLIFAKGGETSYSER